MGKSTISMAIFNSFLLVHQRVYPIQITILLVKPHETTIYLTICAMVKVTGFFQSTGKYLGCHGRMAPSPVGIPWTFKSWWVDQPTIGWVIYYQYGG